MCKAVLVLLAAARTFRMKYHLSSENSIPNQTRPPSHMWAHKLAPTSSPHTSYYRKHSFLFRARGIRREDFSPTPYRIPTIFALMSGAYTRLHIKILTRRKKCGRRRRRRSKAPGLLRGSIPGLMSPAKEGSFLPPMCDGKMQRRGRGDGRRDGRGACIMRRIS